MPELHPKNRHATVAAYLKCLSAAKGDHVLAEQYAREKYSGLPVLPRIFDWHARAAVGATPLGSSDPFGFWQDAFTSMLVDDLNAFLGRCTLVPSRVKVPGENASGTTASWTGQGLPGPILKSTTEVLTLDIFKLTAQTAITRELLRFGVTGDQVSMKILRDAVSRSFASALLDPNKAATSANPASLTNIAGHVTSTGSSASQMITDLNSLIALQNTACADLVWCMRPKTLARINATLAGAGLNPTPGSLLGLPAFVFSGMPQLVALIDCKSVYYTNEGAELSLSTEASVEMADNPGQSGISGTGASMVSFFQSGLVGIQASIFVNWSSAFFINASPNVPSSASYMSVTY